MNTANPKNLMFYALYLGLGSLGSSAHAIPGEEMFDVQSFADTLAEPVSGPDRQEEFRCERDSLSNEQALGRLGWASGIGVKDTSGNPLAIEWALTANDYHPALKGRPLYPTFGVPAGPRLWDYPGDWVAPVKKNSKEKIPKDYVLSVYCTASCYKPGMKVLLENGYETIDWMTDADQTARVMALSDQAELGKEIALEAVDIKAFTKSLDDAQHDISVLTMADGSVLKLTPNHTLVDPFGQVREVSDFKAGDALLKASGESVVIRTIEHERFFGKVLNLTAKSDDMKNQVLVAEGFLTGSAAYQNVELTDANRHLFRLNLKYLNQAE